VFLDLNNEGRMAMLVLEEFSSPPYLYLNIYWNILNTQDPKQDILCNNQQQENPPYSPMTNN